MKRRHNGKEVKHLNLFINLLLVIAIGDYVVFIEIDEKGNTSKYFEVIFLAI